MTTERASDAAWTEVRERLHAEGLRWTPQRRTLVEVLSHTDGHVTGAEVVERCRAMDPTTTPSTVYRTLDVLEALGYVTHHHGVDGREEYHVLPTDEHGHLHCRSCGASWEIHANEAEAIGALFASGRSFAIDRSHITVSGRCADCVAAEREVDG
jgi:Fur family transcriptional regulator, ferric uptake regulator